MATVRQSAPYTRLFLMVQSGDHTTPATGLTVSVSISKAGAAFAAATGSVSEVANGWYRVNLLSADTGTTGDLAYHCTATGADPTDFVDQIVNPYWGDTLNANLSQIMATPVVSGAVDSATLTPTTTEFETNLSTAYAAESYVGQALYWTAGGRPALVGKTYRVSGYQITNSKVHLTVSTMPVAPSNNDVFVLLGRIGS
jgi:hypothetical protein